MEQKCVNNSPGLQPIGVLEHKFGLFLVNPPYPQRALIEAWKFWCETWNRVFEAPFELPKTRFKSCFEKSLKIVKNQHEWAFDLFRTRRHKISFVIVVSERKMDFGSSEIRTTGWIFFWLIHGYQPEIVVDGWWFKPRFSWLLRHTTDQSCCFHGQVAQTEFHETPPSSQSTRKLADSGPRRQTFAKPGLLWLGTSCWKNSHNRSHSASRLCKSL